MTTMRKSQVLAMLTLLIAALVATGTFKARGQTDTPAAPRVISSDPAPHAEIVPGQPIQLTFDQPMDRASVQAALRLTPELNPQFAWRDDQTLTVTFAQPPTRGKQYTLTLGAGVKSASGVPLADNYRLPFDVADNLKITQVIPAPDTTGVQAASTLTVVFNRPVVPLVNTADQASLPQPLTLTPAISGHGEWVSTSIYVFHPDKPLPGGTAFTATISGTLRDVTDSPLAAPYTWKFTTIAPQVLSVNPQPNQQLVGLDDPITIAFNQPMDTDSTQKAFRIVNAATGAAVDGKFTWDATNQTLTFQPAARLPYATSYAISLTASAHSAAGAATLTNPFAQNFTTVPLPALLNTQPVNGAQNVPPGSGVYVQYNAPMDPKSFAGKVHVSPAADNLSIENYGQQLSINFTSLPVTTYTVTIDAGVTDVYGTAITTPTVITFTTGALPPQLGLGIRGMVSLTNAYRTDTILAAQSVNISRIDIGVYTTTLPDVLLPRGDTPPPNAQIIRAIQQPVENSPNKPIVTKIPLKGAQGGVLPPGLYWARVSSPELSKAYNSPYHQDFQLAVATLNLTFKLAPKEALIWATDLKSGQPAADAPITIYRYDYSGQPTKVIATGATDANGLYRVALDGTPNNNALWAVSQAENQFGIVSSQSEQVRPLDASIINSAPSARPAVYLYTDQPLYRPGHPVYFRGIVRDQNDVQFSVPAGKPVHVTVQDAQGKPLADKDMTLDDFGAFSDHLDLAADAPLGSYQMIVTYAGQTFGQGFQVAEYRPPEFQVNATAKVDQVVANDTIAVDIDSKFFFGGAVTNAKLTWNAIANPSYFHYTGDGSWTFGSPNYLYESFSGGDLLPTTGGGYYGLPGYQRPVGSGTGTTDANGHFTITLPADLGGINTTQSFTVEATLTDVSNQAVSGRTTITVHPAKLYVGLHPDNVVAEAGKPFTTKLIAVGWDSAPIPNQKVRVDVSLLKWEQDPKTLAWSQTKTPVIGDDVTTDAKGQASYAFTPSKSGQYIIEASARDSGEKLTTSGVYVWVSGSDPFNFGNPDDKSLKLVADKKLYLPGETAGILIPSPFSGPVKALVTVERAGIMKTEVIDVKGGFTYKLPMTMADAPDVYVSVTLMAGMSDKTPNPDYRSGVVQLHTRVTQKLIVKLTPATDKAKPGDTVHFDVYTTDLDGKPIAAAVGLSLTDLANLSVADSNSGGIFEAFWSDRGLSVQTSVALADLIDTLVPQINQPCACAAPAFDGAVAQSGVSNAAAPSPPSRAALPSTAGGAADEQGKPPPIAVRTNFVDTPFWNPAVITGADGHGGIDVKLPDNLTTWRLDGRGISKDTYAGQSTTDIISTKPLLIRPTTPRFFVVGDQAQLSAVVNNNTDKDLSVAVTLDAKGAILTGDPSQTVNIAKGGRVRVNWTASVGNVANVDLTFTAVSGEFNDASKPAVGIGDARLLPVYQYVAPDYVATAGLLTAAGTRTEGILLPSATAAPTSGELTIKLNSSLAAATLDGLTYLANYPYDCTEQTVSKFLPNVITFRALQKLGLDTPVLKANLQTAINQALAKLRANQHADGGWGWYPQDISEKLVTAYVTLGLVEAKASDLLVDPSMLDRAVRFVLAQPVTVSRDVPLWTLNTETFVQYGLVRAGNGNPANLDALFGQREKMSLFARAFLAQAYHGMNGDANKINALLSDLSNAAILSGTGAHWEESQQDWWNWDSNTRTTAIVLKTLVDLTPDSALIPNVVRWLMVARRGDGWESTQETAWAVMGLTDWMVASGELKANYSFNVALNGAAIGEGKATPATVRDTTTLTIDVKQLLADRVNKLAVARTEGQGALYYTAALYVEQPVEAIAPTSRGLSFTRQYLLNGKPVTSATVGDTLTAVLDITIPHELYYAVINDPIPAGLEAVDTSLKTTTQIGQAPDLDRINPFEGWGWWWFSETQLKTEKVVLTARYLPAGTYRYTYQLRASSPGVYRVIPPNGNEFYFPEVFGRGAGSLFTVKDTAS